LKQRSEVTIVQFKTLQFLEKHRTSSLEEEKGHKGIKDGGNPSHWESTIVENHFLCSWLYLGIGHFREIYVNIFLIAKASIFITIPNNQKYIIEEVKVLPNPAHQ
jgi:hypothetical protein